MSVYSEVSTSFRDPELLIEALKEMGAGQVLNHVGSPQVLKGYDKKKANRGRLAEIIVPKNFLRNTFAEVGFARQEDGSFGAIIDECDGYRLNDKWLGKLKAKYAEVGIMRQAKRKGLLFKGRKVVNGKVELQFLAR